VACEWYSELKQFLPILGKTNDEWLPKNYSFPESLEEWLGNPEYIKSTTMSILNTKFSSTLPVLKKNCKQLIQFSTVLIYKYIKTKCIYFL
jgi:hypothetical protein